MCNGALDIGDHVYMNARVSLFCAKQIVIGRDALIAWDTTIMDNDFHELRDAENNWINPPAAVLISERAWVGFGVTITKKTQLAPGTVIGAGAVVRSEFPEPNCVLKDTLRGWCVVACRAARHLESALRITYKYPV